jgi:uncharacterized RDD family membrane protein YckC
MAALQNRRPSLDVQEKDMGNTTEDDLNENPYKPPRSTLAKSTELQGFVDNKMENAPAKERFSNLLIDSIVLFGIQFLALRLYALISKIFVEIGPYHFSIAIMFFYIFVLTTLGYYILCEGLTGKTVGKLVTKTKVVREDGGKPALANIVGRSCARLIPFEWFSFLSERGHGWHDRFSRTRVVLIGGMDVSDTPSTQLH